MLDVKDSCSDFVEMAKRHRLSLPEMKSMLTRTAVRSELIKCNGNQSEAARRLKINRITLRKYAN